MTETPPPPPQDETPPPEGAAPQEPMGPLEVPNDARTMGMLCHLLSLVGLLGIPFGNILGPLIIWLVKKNDHPFIDDQGKESLNFQITVMIAILICIPLMFVCVGFILAPAIGIAAVVLVIIASIRASKGEAYRYPWTLRLIK